MKKHLTKSNIPKDEKKQFIVLKNPTDILGVNPSNIPNVHKYCLDLSPGIIKHMNPDQLLAFTLEQIVYIPAVSLPEFPDEILDHFKKEAEAFEGTIEYRYSDREGGKKVYKSEQVRPYECIITALAQKAYREKISARTLFVRNRVFEGEWATSGRIHARDLGYLLGCSLRSAENFLEGSKVDGTRHEYYYKDALKVVRKMFVVNKDADPAVKEELKMLGYTARGLKRLPVTYSLKEVLEKLEIDLEEPSEKILDRLEEICEEQAYLDLPINSRNSMRFLKSVYELGFNDPVFVEERERIKRLKEQIIE